MPVKSDGPQARQFGDRCASGPFLETRLSASGRSFVFWRDKARSVYTPPRSCQALFGKRVRHMTATALAPPRFVRRTQLGAHEYRKNFHQIDHDVMAAVTSVAADRVTPLMSKIYLRLVSAPTEFWEREGVLYFAPRDTEGHPVKASKVLYGVLGVASATAHKALQWLHGQGIIGYFAGKNGVGIR